MSMEGFILKTTEYNVWTTKLWEMCVQTSYKGFGVFAVFLSFIKHKKWREICSNYKNCRRRLRKYKLHVMLELLKCWRYPRKH